jgi:D-glycero-alpha-D-manno-heptose-7-phosphate kinase
LLLPTGTLAELEGNLMLFYTGTQRDARTILGDQATALENDDATVTRMQQMVDLAYEMRDQLLAGDLDAFGSALHRGWEMKRGLSAQISTSAIDQHYERARSAGALGGKIAGAGGGGFLLLYCPKAAQARVRTALDGLQSLEFRFDWGGARLAFAQ